MEMNKGGIYRRFFKRPMDFVLSLIAIILLSPVFLVVAILVRTKLGSPILFRQKRPGLNEEIFEMYKFRSMTSEKDSNGDLLPDSVRLTKFGRLLRSTSLDELPGLFNILKGDMSIVGPRPLAIEYLPYYTPEERVRHSIRPGLSGLAQINGRNTATWEQRFYYDIEYIKNISFANDMNIILKTILKAVNRSDIGERGVDVPQDFHTYRKNILEREDAK
ncbi:sugar transferase [Planococcus beigongshangi]|uniref:sugar transferase n=1 Tax=Planococcus beigongshangi TaxID=2782536 RepID=UPI001EEE5559|nr:sugar transferase [Planococcus beigongshangi]